MYTNIDSRDMDALAKNSSHIYRIQVGEDLRTYWFDDLDGAVAAAMANRLFSYDHFDFNQLCREEEGWECFPIPKDMAMNHAFARGWDGTGLNIFEGEPEGDFVLLSLCEHSAQLAGGGLTEEQADLIQRRMMAPDIPILALALAKASFHRDVAEETVARIRQDAEAVWCEGEILDPPEDWD